MGSFLQDLRYGIRMLLKAPGMTGIAVLTLALGIGANLAIFSVVYAVLLKPLPYAHAERVVMAWESNLSKGWSRTPVSPPDFADWQAENRVFDALAAIVGRSFVLTGKGEPERISGVGVTQGLFPVVGVPPLLGRPFRNEEFARGNDRVVVVDYALWQRRFAGSLELPGKTLKLNGESYTIIGVMPEWFRVPTGADLMVPMTLTPEQLSARGSRYLMAMGRLKPGVTVDQAQTEMSGLAERLARRYPDTNTGWGARIVSLREQVVGTVRPALLSLFAAVGFVLLIACANVTSLLLARAATRRKEMALRSALGAMRGRLVRQLLTETILLFLLGGGFGLLFGGWGIDLLKALQPADLPRLSEVELNGPVFLLALAVSVLCGVLFGVIPAILASRANLQDTLKEGGRDTAASGGHRVRSALVVAQVALSLILLVGAGLVVRSFRRLMSESPGFDSSNVLTLRVALPVKKYPEAGRQAAFFRQALEKLRQLPGVKTAGAVSMVPFSDSDMISVVKVEGRPPAPPGQDPSALWYAVSPDYFRAMAVPLVRGRLFTERDTVGTPRVALINETMARKVFPGEDPIGRRFTLDNEPAVAREIVGIVKDVKHYGLEYEATLQLYEPFLQTPTEDMTLLLRSGANPVDLAPAAREVIHALDPDQPVSEVRTLEDLVSSSTAPRRFNMLLITLFAVVALVLVAVGIYGVVAYSVAQRTREIGVRMALGARRGDVLSLVLRQGMFLVTGGVAVGLAGAMALTRLIAKLLFGVGALDAVTFLSMPLVLGAVALLACYIPARRAARVDPMVALHYE